MIHRIAGIGLFFALSACVSADVAVVAAGTGAEMALRQAQTWPLQGAALAGQHINAPAALVAAVSEATDAQTLLLFREEDKPGASVVVTSSASARPLADRIAAALAADAAASTAPPTTRPAYAEPTGEGALLKAVQGAKSSVIVVTAPTSRRTPVSERARTFRIAIKEALGDAYAGSVDVVLPPRDTSATDAVRIGIYDGPGSNSSPGPQAMYGIMEKTPGAIFTFVGPREMNRESLAQFDVVMFPGGSGGGQARAVGEAGRDAIRDFVRDGGAYIGNCAGGYFASTSYDWSLNLLNVKTLDTENNAWARGSGDVQVEFTDEGKHLLGGDGTVTLRYANGPIYGKGDRADLPEVQVLAYYRSQISRNPRSQDGVMLDTPAIVAAPYGKGRALAFSCHPEYSKEYTDFVRRAVKWVTKKE